MFRLNNNVIVFCLLFVTLPACGLKYNVKMQVVDAESGKPIENAVIAINYYKYSGCIKGIGLSSGYRQLYRQETTSDAQGYFKITKYLFRNFKLGVYKKGYVAWYNKIKFPSRKNRIGFSIRPGKKIELDPFKYGSLEAEHAAFAISVDRNCDAGPLFNKAIENEEMIYRHYYIEGGRNEK